MATWRMWGEKFEAADAVGTRIHQPVIFHKNVSLLATRAWMVFYNNSAWSNLTMKIYSDDNGQPGNLINTSTTLWQPSDLYTEAYAAKEMYFEWDKPVFKAEDTYHFVINMSTYIGTGSSHVSWKNTFPDPPFKTGLTLTYEKLLTYPFDLTFVLSELK
jgi:hypothetical protein